jgi:hypothetical protein
MRPVSLKIGTGDFALAAGHRRNATGLLIERSSSGARCLRIIGFKSCTAMLAGLPTLIQTRHGPDRYVPLTFFDTMPSAASRQACAKTTQPSYEPRYCAKGAPARPCGRQFFLGCAPRSAEIKMRI